MATGTEDRAGTLSGMTAAEAREFHRLFVTSFIGFVVVALVAHVLAWAWRPWLPGEEGYGSLMDGLGTAAQTALTLLA